MEERPDVAEAIRRLPEKEQNLRIFRIKRALDLSLKHSQLPREQWTKPEEVRKHADTCWWHMWQSQVEIILLCLIALPLSKCCSAEL